jgi:transcriptional regulator with XRE-family HTH domain
MSQQALAEAAGCSIASVALFERGLAPEHSEVLPRIERALDEAIEAVAAEAPLNDEAPLGTSGASRSSGRQARHAAG